MKIWFNQSFSLRNVIARIVRDRPSIRVVASATDPAAPTRDVASQFWMEPARGAANYGDWILSTAIREGVDAVVGGRGRSQLARMKRRFRDAGIALHVAADADTLDLLDDKAAFSQAMAEDPTLARTIAVRSARAFVDAVEAIGSDAVACVKPIRGIYGAGYWTLNAKGPFDHLADPDARRIMPEIYAAALRQAEDAGASVALLVMEHLPGVETSVDLVCRSGEVMLAAVRTKLDANSQRIETRHSLIAHATGLVGRFCLHGAVNIQYKQDRHGEWRILEINTRAAGGASYCDAVGIPFSTTWADVVTGHARHFEDVIDAEIVAIAHAERREIQNGSASTSQA